MSYADEDHKDYPLNPTEIEDHCTWIDYRLKETVAAMIHDVRVYAKDCPVGGELTHVEEMEIEDQLFQVLTDTLFHRFRKIEDRLQDSGVLADVGLSRLGEARLKQRRKGMEAFEELSQLLRTPTNPATLKAIGRLS